LSLKKVIDLNVNGEIREVLIEPRTTLLHVLREDLGLTGTKQACDTGDCGACTVLINGKPAVSCLTLAIEVQEREILTIEGLCRNGKLHPLQQAFVDHFAVQCGFCTPGMILSAKALLGENPHPSEEEIREAISGNLCRCTGYVKIVEAIIAATKNLQEQEP
jgi:carbon-monoxide dehydrogenase small subunit